MSSTQSSSTMSTANSQSQSQSGCLDPLDSMIDFSEYEQVSPSGTKTQFTTRPVSNTPPVLPSSQPALSRPSHNYDMYRQQTGIPKGAMANTLAINSNNMHISQYGYAHDNYLSGLSPSDDFVDFGSAPTKYNASEIDMEFDSPNGEPAFFYPEQSPNEFIDPSAINGLPAAPVLANQPTGGRLYPGIHQHQAAIAKAQAQQKQQQQIIQLQRQNAMGGQSRQTSQRIRASSASDPIVEEKISQLLKSMRHSSVTSDDNDSNSQGNMSHVQRMRKDEEDMDEDERLLASEEGKKLSSKERRQLRNKVSARAFRSRRKGKQYYNISIELMLTFHRIHWTARGRDRTESQRERRSSITEPCLDGGEHPSLRPHSHAPLFTIILWFPRHSLPKPSCSTDCTCPSSTTTTTTTTATG